MSSTPNALSWNLQESGSGAIPLVCVHGWCCDGGHFSDVAEKLASGFRIYRPDLPGHGGTPLGDFSPSFENYAQTLADWIAARAPKSPILLGHSMGGVLALMVAARVQARAVINLDGSLPAAARSLAGQAQIRSWRDLPDFRERLAGALREGFFLPHERDSDAESVIRQMCSAPEAVLRFLPEEAPHLNPAQILSEVRMPVLYIGAENPRFDLDRARVLLPQLRFEPIRHTGHFLPLRAPERVTELVRSFVTETGIC
jgi:pimeloyl-ACP methyl ester carboxylesterase